MIPKEMKATGEKLEPLRHPTKLTSPYNNVRMQSETKYDMSAPLISNQELLR